jgi:hypothetical protein
MLFMPTLAARAEFAINWASRYRYLLLVFFLLLHVLAFSLQGIWVEDFWEHSAAVSEFMRHPLAPSHPQLDLAAPHTFLNPYTFVVALTALIFSLNSITILAFFGVFNFCLFCWGLSVFISSHCSNRDDSYKVSFYALLFILFLWGSHPWAYSGFFNYQIFLFNLPYPSTFIGGLSLLTLGLTGRSQTTLGLTEWLVLVVITTLSLLTHPLTAQFLVIGLIAQALTVQERIVIRLLKLATLCAASIALAALWPFFPFLSLLSGAGTVYDLSNLLMYFDVIDRVWPFILLSPVLAWTLYQRQYRVLLFIFFATIGVYLFGLYSHKYSYGRIISYTIIIAQICCAIVAVQLETWLDHRHPRIRLTYHALLLTLLLFLSSGWLYTSTTRLLTAANSIWLGRPVFNHVSYKEYNALRAALQSEPNVLANLDTSWLLPSFGAKIVGVNRAFAFVKDIEQRKKDTTDFFDLNIGAQARQVIIQRYKPTHILFNKLRDQDWMQIKDELVRQNQSTTHFENHDFLLMKLP